MNSKKVTIISIALAICLCIFGGIAVFAITVNGQKTDKNEPPKEFNDQTRKMARIDKIDGNNVTVTFESFKRPDENSNPENSNPENQNNINPSDNTSTEAEQKTLTVKDTSLLDGITEGSMVMLELDPNDQNIIIGVENENQMRGKSKEGLKTGRIDSIDGDKVTVTLGELGKPEENNNSESQPSDNFTLGTETKTYSVKDTNLLTNLKVGDIVMLKVSQSDETVLDEIKSLDEMPMEKPKDFNQKESSENSESKSNFSNKSVNTENI